MKGKIVLPLVIALACLISNNAMAVSGRATDAVRGMMDQVIAIQNNQGLQGQEGQATKKTEIRNVILKNFNFEEMMKGALGQYYSSLNQAQLTEFKSVFQDLFLISYAKMVMDFVKNEKIDFKGESEGGSQVTVKTVMKFVGSDITVDYSLMQKSGKYQVSDVAADGVSMVGNYRSAFSRVMKQEGYTGLLKRMKLQQQAAGMEQISSVK